jgi:hypothetical protein
MTANARLLNVVWQRLVAHHRHHCPTSCGGTLGCLSLAICEAHLDLTTHPDPQTSKDHPYVITHQHKIASGSGADALAVRHLAV